MKPKKPPEQSSSNYILSTDPFSEEHPYPILRLSLNGQIIYANPASMPVLLEWGTEVRGMVGDEILKIAQQVSMDGIAQKMELQHGRVVIELTFSPSSSSGYINIFGQDISIQKMAKKAMLESRDEAREAKLSLENAEVIGRYGSWELNLETKQVKWSKGLFLLFGLSPEECVPSLDSFYDLVDPAHHEKMRSILKTAIENPHQEFRMEYSINRKDNKRLHIREVGGVVLGESGTPVKLVGLTQDVTALALAQEEAQFYKSALDKAAIVAITDRKGVITHVNENFCEISGYQKEELLGKTHQILNSKVMAPGFFSAMWKEISAGKIWKGEICNRAKDGRHYWVDTAIIPFLDSQKKPERYMAIRADITARKRAEQELMQSREATFKAYQRLEEAEKVGQFGSWEWNLREHSFFCSRGFFQIMQCQESTKPTYKLFMEHVLDDDRKVLEPAMEEAIAAKQPFTCNYRIKAGDGTIRWLRSEGHPQCDEDGNVIKLMGTAQDVTEKTKAEIELMEATLRAEEATKTKAEFLANMSHEIRTPMNGVIGMCNLLLAEIGDPAHIERLQIIQNCGNALLNLINDILDFSKLEAGKIELENEPFDIHHTAREIVQLFNTKASEKGILLSYTPEPSVPTWVLGDTTRFRQILSNLLNNSIKFTDKGSVAISSKAEKQKSGKLEIQFSVKDTGIGISEAARDKLFNSFSQADVSTTRKYGGTGLGLAISKGLCEKMGGKIWLDSMAGVGSTFYFSMVLSETQSKKDTTATGHPIKTNAEMGKKHPLNILIAEDNRVNQLVAVGLLEKLGYRPDVAANGLEVLDALMTKSYDLIFMDFHMPEMDGIEATRKIHEKYPKSKRPHITALTASAMKEDVDRCYSAGMDDFISKPIQVKEMVRVLSSITNAKNIPTKENTHPNIGANMPEEKPVLDRIAIAENFSGLEDILHDTIESFLRLKPTLMQNIKQAIEAKDASALENAAHSLKGSVSNFFAEPAKMIAYELEKAGSSGQLEHTEENFQKLSEEMEKVCIALQELKSYRSAA